MSKKKAAPAAKYRVKNALVNYYLVLMFTLFPLFFTQQYSNIRHDKLYLFIVLSLMLIFGEGIVLLVSLSDRERNPEPGKKPWYRELGATDIAFGALVLCYVISTVFSGYPLDSLTGNQGRNNGLLLMIIYFLIYIIISRSFVFKDYVFAAFAVCSSAVFLLAALNFFYIDPLSMFSGYSDKIVNDFISTIGNKNIMSCYCCLSVSLFFMLFINTAGPLRYLYLTASGLGFSAMLCADSESGILGLSAAAAFALILYSKNSSKLRDLFVSLSVMLIFAKLFGLFALVFGGGSKELGAIQRFFVYDPLSFILLGVFAFSALLCLRFGGSTLPKAFTVVIVSAVAFTVLVVLGAFVYFTFIDAETPLDGAMSYFRFSDKWGTHRGYIWRKSAEIFAGSDIKSMLFGSGPDTLYSQFSPYFGELKRLYGDSSTNCAHNELLNYLVTTGVLGLGAYIALFSSALVRAVRSKKALAAVFAVPVFSYLAQSVVNIATPITTPLLFIMLALSLSCAKKE